MCDTQRGSSFLCLWVGLAIIHGCNPSLSSAVPSDHIRHGSCLHTCSGGGGGGVGRAGGERTSLPHEEAQEHARRQWQPGMGGALRLRGGAREGRLIRCPSKEYPSVKAALEACCKGDVALLCGTGGGEHRIGGTISIGNRTLDVAGEEGACILGKLLFRDGSRGTMSGVSCVVDWREEDFGQEWVLGEPISAMGYTVMALSGPWIFDRCRVEASTGPEGGEAALAAGEDALLTLNATHVGGQGEGGDRVDIGVYAFGRARLELHSCGVSLCSRFGIKANDRSRVILSGGAIGRSRVGLIMANECEVTVARAEVGGEEAAFAVEDRARFTAKLFTTDTNVVGQRWLYDMLPCKHSGDPCEQEGVEEDEWSEVHAAASFREQGMAAASEDEDFGSSLAA